MRKIFLDCGSNVGQGLDAVYKKVNMDDSWEIICFEPNENCHKWLKKTNIYKNHKKIETKSEALWIKNESKAINKEYLPFLDDEIINLGVKYGDIDDWVGGSTHILEENNFRRASYIREEHMNKSDKLVQCIDFSKFILDNFSKEDFLVIKMDIEGVEYEVLTKMIEDGSLDYVNTLFVEWHSRLREDSVNEQYLLSEIHKRDIMYEEWV